MHTQRSVVHKETPTVPRVIVDATTQERLDTLSFADGTPDFVPRRPGRKKIAPKIVSTGTCECMCMVACE